MAAEVSRSEGTELRMAVARPFVAQGLPPAPNAL